MVGRVQIHPIPAGLEIEIGPQSLWTCGIGKPASGVQGANVGTTAEPPHGFFVKCRLGGPVTSFVLAFSAPKRSHLVRCPGRSSPVARGLTKDLRRASSTHLERPSSQSHRSSYHPHHGTNNTPSTLHPKPLRAFLSWGHESTAWGTSSRRGPPLPRTMYRKIDEGYRKWCSGRS